MSSGSEHDEHGNAYRTAPEKPGDEQGYHIGDPDQHDEGYTAEGVLRRYHEKSQWGRKEDKSE